MGRDEKLGAVPTVASFAERPLLVFWETTRACFLACRHCRASATPQALPGELDWAQGLQLLDQITAFAGPPPRLVLTGGDCLFRLDLFDLVDAARTRGIPVCLSPSVTPLLLSTDAITRIADSGVEAVSISLDGALPATHDGVRGIDGLFDKTIEAICRLVDAGLTVQVNTTVMRRNVGELAEIAELIVRTGAQTWEVFFVVPVGRGTSIGEVTPEECEDVCHFLYDASRYGFTVRTVEAPFFRRVVAERRAGGPPSDGALYRSLSLRLREKLGPVMQRPRAHTSSTRDGKGIVFVAYNGDVCPAGFLPVPVGNVLDRPLTEIYRDAPLLRAIRAAAFTGRCGRCEYADLCGGSRARAYAASGDPLGEDPACPYQPPAETALT